MDLIISENGFKAFSWEIRGSPDPSCELFPCKHDGRHKKSCRTQMIYPGQRTGHERSN